MSAMKCPECGKELAVEDDGLACVDCGIMYPPEAVEAREGQWVREIVLMVIGEVTSGEGPEVVTDALLAKVRAVAEEALAEEWGSGNCPNRRACLGAFVADSDKLLRP